MDPKAHLIIKRKQGAEPPPRWRSSARPIRRLVAKVGRNEPCWCNSGKKYKTCHLPKDRERGLV